MSDLPLISFASVWNTSIATVPRRPLEKRDHVWASEIGGSMTQAWLRMRGTEATNPPNSRSRRKFEAGHMFEWIGEVVLRRAGVWIEAEKKVALEMPGCPRITGRLDHLVGGNPDWDRAEAEFKQIAKMANFPEFIVYSADNIINHFKANYPTGMRKTILEFKSKGSYLFPRYQIYNVIDIHHEFQLWTYLKAEGLDAGMVVYISKDDLLMHEIPIVNPNARIEVQYTDWVKELDGHHKANEMPPLDPEVRFDEVVGNFKDNWNVKYNDYLTMLYPKYNSQADYEDRWKPVLARWNRVLNRLVRGDNITKANQEVIDEIKAHFAVRNLDEYVAIAKEAQAKKVKFLAQNPEL